MPTILIPQNVTVKVPLELLASQITNDLLNLDEPPTRDKNIRFVEDFVESRCKDTAGLQTADALFISIDIRAAFKGKKPGDRVKLTETHYDHLKKLVEKPTGGYGPFGLDLGPFILAVRNPAGDSPALVEEPPAPAEPPPQN